MLRTLSAVRDPGLPPMGASASSGRRAGRAERAHARRAAATLPPMRARVLPVLLALAVAPAGVVGCGGDDAPPPTTTTAKKEPATKVVRGFQFQVAMPYRWADVRDQLQKDEDQEAAYDIAFGNVFAKGYKPTVYVTRHRSAAITKESLTELERDIRKSTPAAKGLTTEAPTPLTVGGSPAIQTVTKGDQGGQELQQRRVYVKHDGTLFTMTFSSAVGDTDADAVLGQLTSSWRWTS